MLRAWRLTRRVIGEWGDRHDSGVSDSSRVGGGANGGDKEPSFRSRARSRRSAASAGAGEASGERRCAGEVESREERADEGKNRGPQQNRLIALRHRPRRSTAHPSLLPPPPQSPPSPSQCPLVCMHARRCLSLLLSFSLSLSLSLCLSTSFSFPLSPPFTFSLTRVAPRSPSFSPSPFSSPFLAFSSLSRCLCFPVIRYATSGRDVFTDNP